MPQAIEPLSRRNFLANTSTAFAVLATGAAGSCTLLAGKPSPDAVLLRLGAELDDSWGRERALSTAMKHGASPELDREMDAAEAVSASVVEKIGALQATTMAGLCVKAKAVSWCHCGEPFDVASLYEGRTVDTRIASGILRDLMAMQGA